MCVTDVLYCDGKDIGAIFIGQQMRLIMQYTKLIIGYINLLMCDIQL